MYQLAIVYSVLRVSIGVVAPFSGPSGEQVSRLADGGLPNRVEVDGDRCGCGW